jgi:formylglycine-generating enzyme required for sulfatase activity
MEFVKLPAGTFWMSKDGKNAQRQITIKEDFYLGKYPVTQEQWQAVMGNNPSFFSRLGNILPPFGVGAKKVKDTSDADLKQFPVECVSWNDVQEFLKKLNASEKKRGWQYRLPNEAEWEYACRGAATSKEDCSFDFYLDKPTNKLSPIEANSLVSSLGRTSKVDSYPPNKLGLYDMHGNVWQWCEDAFNGGPDRVIRGGSWNDSTSYCRARSRTRLPPSYCFSYLGFRLARVPVAKESSESALGEKEADRKQVPKGAGGKQASPLGMEFVKVPAGTFWMSQDGKNAQRQVTIKDDFYLGVYPVTQGQWQAIMGKNPSYFSRTGGGKEKVKAIADANLKRFPVEEVSWEDVQKFLQKLKASQKESGWRYRLPTEAEWEYACRGGATPKDECSFDFYFREKSTNDLSSTQANFHGDFPAGNAPKGPNLGRSSKVGSYPPNKLGLYDMHRNVWQWCEDAYDGGSGRVIRGGAWSGRASDCRATVLLKRAPTFRSGDLGFRLVRVPVGKESSELAPGEKEADRKQVPKGAGGNQAGPLGMKFVWVPKGEFWMSQDGKNAQRQVTIKRSFQMAVYLVTQKQWQAVMGNNPSFFSRSGGGQGQVKDIADNDLKQFPVESVSWNDVQEFLKKLNASQKKKGWLYRLPTDAEWEYACRGAATSKEECSFDFYFDRPTNDLSSTQANFHGDFPAGNAPKGPFLGRPSKVGLYPPNKLGLYDMNGNVWQWCEDALGSDRVFRGGCWGYHARYCRAADRGKYAASKGHNHRGFRLVRVLSGK